VVGQEYASLQSSPKEETKKGMSEKQFKFKIRQRIFCPLNGSGVVIDQKLINDLPCATCIFPKWGTTRVTLLESKLLPVEMVAGQETEIEFEPNCDLEEDEQYPQYQSKPAKKQKCQPIKVGW
jgi:hypothetical protein